MPLVLRHTSRERKICSILSPVTRASLQAGSTVYPGRWFARQPDAAGFFLCRGFVADRCCPSYHKSSSSLSTSICGAAATLLSSFLRVTNAISAE